MKTAITRMLLVFAMAVAGIVVGQVSAQAACSGAGCSGLDPQAQGCTNAVNLDTRIGSTGALKYEAFVRSSSTCNARWVRVIVDVNSCCFTNEFAVESQRLVGSTWVAAEFQSVTVGSGVVGTFWTNMVNNRSDDRVRACIRLVPNGGWECGKWAS